MRRLRAKSIFWGLGTGLVAALLLKILGAFIIPDFPVNKLLTIYNNQRLILVLPLAAQLWIVAAWAFGSFITGLVSSILNQSKTMTAAILSGSLFLIFATYNLVLFPHPEWMNVAGVFVPMLFALLGYKTIQREKVRA